MKELGVFWLAVLEARVAIKGREDGVRHVGVGAVENHKGPERSPVASLLSRRHLEVRANRVHDLYQHQQAKRRESRHQQHLVVVHFSAQLRSQRVDVEVRRELEALDGVRVIGRVLNEEKRRVLRRHDLIEHLRLGFRERGRHARRES